MGSIKWFSSDSRDVPCTPFDRTNRTVIKEVRVNSTPDPANFIIIKHEVVNGFPIYLVRYPGVENFEGHKVLMYPQNFNTDLLANRMEPHFFTKGDSPIARFEPTSYGWLLAITLAKTMNNGI